jgi:protein MpaA
VNELDIGRSVLGRDIKAFHFTPPSYAKPRDAAVLFGAIHGDEPLGIYCLVRLVKDLAERPPGRETWIIPALNPDGVAAGTKNNASNVDLNRNFAASNWAAKSDAGYNPGPTPESEPETQCLVALIERANATRLIALHSPFHCIDWDGSGEVLAREMSARNDYPVWDEIGYPTLGSFGSKYGVDLAREVITVEIPLVSEEEAWMQNRAALRWSVDLP